MKRLAQLRKEKGLNQTGLAMKLNITQYMVSAYENGRNQPSIDLLIQMADFFHVSVDYLLERSDVRAPLTAIPVSTLTAEEVTVLTDYRQLSPEQRAVARGMLVALQHYKDCRK